MAIITLTSDWNNDDFYVGAVKGKLLSLSPSSTVIDISHKVKPYNYSQASFIIRNSYLHFPEGSIHIIAVNSQSSKTLKNVIVKINGHYFIGSDNGIFSLISNKTPEIIIELNDDFNLKEGTFQSTTFPALNLFVNAAAHISNNKEIKDLGVELSDIESSMPFRPSIEGNTIIGSVIYIDSYSNIITNISKSLFDEVGKGRTYEIFVQSSYNIVTKINEIYNETKTGNILAIFNSLGLLEIAQSNDRLADLQSIEVNSNISIIFRD